MNNKTTSLKIVIPVISFLGFILIITFMWWFINKDKTATIDVLVAPRDSKILIGDKTYKNGTYKLKPGKYNVNISKTDFNSYIGTITVEKDQTIKLYKALLQTDGSYSWYLKNEEDDLILTRIGNQAADSSQNDIAKKYPILEFIPYTEQSNGITYKIDTQFNGDSLEYLEIYFNTCSSYSYSIYKTEALNWIRSKGFNPEDYTIKYSSLCSDDLQLN